MKNLKKKIKKVLKLNKKTNKIKNDNKNNVTASNRRIKSAEQIVTNNKTTTTSDKKLPTKLFTDKTFFTFSTKPHSIIKKETIIKINEKKKTSPLSVEELVTDQEETTSTSSLSSASSSPEIIVVTEPTEEQAKEKNQLDKRERIDLYKKLLTLKPPACNINEAFDLINKTLVEIEDKYGPRTDNKSFYYSKRYGRMFPLTKEKLKFNPESGRNEMITVGFMISIEKNGTFQFWSKNPGCPTLIFSKFGGKPNNNNNNLIQQQQQQPKLCANIVV